MTFNFEAPTDKAAATRTWLPWLAGLLLALLSGAACAPAAQAPGAPAIAAVHRHQCGRCHTPPPPGQHPRLYLEEALGHHHKRVHLSDEEWTELIDYLAASRTSASGGGPSGS
jgi:uncharacterized Zn-finger protein